MPRNETPRKRLTEAQRVRVFDGNGGICHICSLPIKVGEAWEADHVRARWKGGADIVGNYKPAHVDPCHKAKSARESGERAKETAIRAKHIGAEIGPDKSIQGRPLPTTRRAANRRASLPNKLPLPARTTDIYGRRI